MQVALAGTNGHVRPVRIALICAAACTPWISLAPACSQRITTGLRKSCADRDPLDDAIHARIDSFLFVCRQDRRRFMRERVKLARRTPILHAFRSFRENRPSVSFTSHAGLFRPNRRYARHGVRRRAASRRIFWFCADLHALADDFPQATLRAAVRQWKHARYASCLSLSSPKQRSIREPICIYRSSGQGAPKCERRTCKNGKSM